MKLIHGNYEAWLWGGVFYVRYFANKGHGVQGVVFDQFPKQPSNDEDWKLFRNVIASHKK